VAVGLVWAGTAFGLVSLRDQRVLATVARWCGRPLVAVGFVAAVAVVGSIAYPVFDGRSATGGGSDADDGVFLVIDSIRDGSDPYARVTYLGNPATTGPGSGLWFLPFGTRALYPLGLALAVAVTIGLVWAAHDEWRHAGLVALLLGTSVPFWEGVGQGSDHLVIGCSLVWAVCLLRSRRVLADPRLLVAGAVLVGTIATARAVFIVVPALAAAGLWWRDRRAAGTFAVVGTAVALALHGWLIARSGWDGYDPVQQLFVKSGDELPGAGKVVLVLGIVAGAALVRRELRRRAAARVDVLLLAGVALPMTAIALAALFAEPIDVWSGANYLLDGLVLAAYWFTTRLLPEPPPGLRPRSG
jgi:hypothetical protein